MKYIFILLMGYLLFQKINADFFPASLPEINFSPTVPEKTYQCDGRVYCSSMTSCEEATYFLQHCPGVKMDGDYDGIPCERQWC